MKNFLGEMTVLSQHMHVLPSLIGSEQYLIKILPAGNQSYHIQHVYSQQRLFCRHIVSQCQIKSHTAFTEMVTELSISGGRDWILGCNTGHVGFEVQLPCSGLAALNNSG